MQHASVDRSTQILMNSQQRLPERLLKNSLLIGSSQKSKVAVVKISVTDLAKNLTGEIAKFFVKRKYFENL